MRFSVYFASILNKKWLFSFRNNDVSCTHARGHAPQRENLEKMSSLVRLGVYFDQILHYIFFKVLSCIEQYDIMLMDVSGYFPYE